MVMDLGDDAPSTLATSALALDLEISLLPVVILVTFPVCGLPSIQDSPSPVVATTREMSTVIPYHPNVYDLSEVSVTVIATLVGDTRGDANAAKELATTAEPLYLLFLPWAIQIARRRS